MLARQSNYRSQTLNLIASENVMSPTVESFFRAELSHRYGDYLGSDIQQRKYTGNRFITPIDAMAQASFQDLFGCRFADVRPLSGHVAGSAVIMALCAPGDAVLELDSAGGGHRLAGKLSQAALCPLRVLPLPFDAKNYNIAIKEAVAMIALERPKLVVLGSSLFLFPHPVRELADAVHAVGGYLLYDASHVLGLIAGGAFPNPLTQGADVVISSTHKTFAGPQGGVLLTNDEDLYERLVPAIYPALVTNHHLHRLPALIAVCNEWQEFGPAHVAAVVAGAKALGAALSDAGLDVIGQANEFTQSHTLLISCANAKSDAARLEEAGIMVTPVGLPPALGAGALRLGVQEVTRLGFVPEHAPRVAALIAETLGQTRPLDEISDLVADLVANYTECRFTWVQA